MTTYRTKFNLLNPVNDVSSAQAYLNADDMTEYLYGEISTLADDEIVKVRWNLVDDFTGFIECEFTRPLTPEESGAVSRWIRGQNSDGLGEGFEQQDFATFVNVDECECCEYEHDCIEDDPSKCDILEPYLAEFDWRFNDYALSVVSN